MVGPIFRGAVRCAFVSEANRRDASIFFADDQMPQFKQKICSVLAGYVWDEKNEFVRDHHASVNKLARIITLRDQISFQS